MRHLLPLILMLNLVGCATVSMVPQTQPVSTRLVAAQTALHQACDSYIKLAASEAWMQPSDSLLDMARTWVDGAEIEDKPTNAYAKKIGAGILNPNLVRARIAADVNLASSQLDGVTQEAQRLLGPGMGVNANLRDDIAIYEQALISAQKSRSNFIEVSLSLGEAVENTFGAEQKALVNFESAIDRARIVADKLALVLTQAETGAGAKS